MSLTPEERAIFEAVKKQVDAFEFHDDPPGQTDELVRCVNHAQCKSPNCLHKAEHRRNDLCETSRCTQFLGGGKIESWTAKCFKSTPGLAG